MKFTYFARCGGYFGFGATAQEAVDQFVKAGGSERKLMQSGPRGIARVAHHEAVTPYIETCTGSIQVAEGGGTDEEKRGTVYAYAEWRRTETMFFSGS